MLLLCVACYNNNILDKRSAGDDRCRRRLTRSSPSSQQTAARREESINLKQAAVIFLCSSCSKSMTDCLSQSPAHSPASKQALSYFLQTLAQPRINSIAFTISCTLLCTLESVAHACDVLSRIKPDLIQLSSFKLFSLFQIGKTNLFLNSQSRTVECPLW